MTNKLKCANCTSDLALHIFFDGCDELSVKGEGSNFDYEICLICETCGTVYSIGRVKRECDFCENLDEYTA